MADQNRYDKMPDYIHALFRVFLMANQRAKNERQKMISLTIYNYALYMSKQYGVELDKDEINELSAINLIPIFEYIAANNVELYDFSTVKIEDIDIAEKKDLERFVLTHVYYLTQK